MAGLPNDPERPRRRGNAEEDSRTVGITVQGDLNYSPNDIAELRKLADDHPELAAKLVDDKHKSLVIENNTERLGMAAAVFLGVVLIIGTTYAIVQLGWWQAIMFVAALLGISHILRTLLKGEFSDTSWFGQIMSKTPKDRSGED